MRSTRGFAASLVLNVVLLTVIAVYFRLHQPAPSGTTGITSAPVLTSSADSPTLPNKTEGPVAPHIPSGLRQWIDLLRDAGAPDSLLATVVRADFDRRWQTRQNEAQKQYLNNEMDIDGLSLLNLAHDADLEKEMRDMLGEEAFRTWDMERQFSDTDLSRLNLSPAETESFYQLRKLHQQQLRQAEMALDRKEVDQATYTTRREEAEADYQAQLRQLLGYQRYNLVKGSGMPADVVHALKAMNVTEEQVGFVENVEQQWKERQSDLQQSVDLGQSDQADFEQQMQALNAWRDQEFQRTLGSNAFAFYQKQQDSRYVDLKSFATTWGLADQDIEQVYRTLSDYDKAVQNYRQQIKTCEANGDQAKQDQLQQTLQSYSAQTASWFQQYLGAQRFNTLKENHILSFN